MPVGDCAETGKASNPANTAAPTAALVRIAALSRCLVVCMPSSPCLTRSVFIDLRACWNEAQMSFSKL